MPRTLRRSFAAEWVTVERVFLGWDAGLLARAAAWLASEFEADMRGVLVALPGARAGRMLEELLACAVGAELRPPKIVTVGILSDALLDVQGVPAGRLVRTLVWERALRELPETQLARIVAHAPGVDDGRAWGALAEEVRGLFGEVAAEGLDFATVERSPILKDLANEALRWNALSAAQARMERQLEAVGMQDPHLGRLQAIQAGRVHTPRHVVLVGAVEMNALLRDALAVCTSSQTALVFAPQEEAARFDAFGCLLPEEWTSREMSLRNDQWHVVDRAADQANMAAKAIASWGSAYSAEQISIGIADAEVTPFIKRRLAESGIRARDAAGKTMARTAAVQLLTTVGSFLRSRAFRDLAVLVRHVDFEAAMRREAPQLEPLETLDEYHRRHLPWQASGQWSALVSDRRDQALRGKMNAVWAAVRSVLGALWSAGEVSLQQQAASLRGFLGRVYGGLDLTTGGEETRITMASLRCLADGLAELEAVPKALAWNCSLPDALDLLVRLASNGQNDVPAAAARAGEATIEMLGWLELPLDNAPALVVLGFQEGQVPESVRGDPYLPNRLRRELGIVDNQRRLARDLYATELLVRSRSHVAFISGRRSLAGDRQLPSRIVFHCPASEVAQRVRRFIDSRGNAPARAPRAADASRRLPRVAPRQAPETISVSAFKTFLDSPYAYYLKHILNLKTVDDRAQELDGAGFGQLAHDALQRFGQELSVRDETDSAKISRYLAATLRTLGVEYFGSRPLPAIHLQLEQLEYRLSSFACAQARRRAAGWRIREVEWAPSGGSVSFPVDGKPIHLSGRIDRIDRHDSTGAWAVWDYKTGETVKQPLLAHRAADGRWKDLQLPLYTFLAKELIGEAPPEELGYIAIGRSTADIEFYPVADWRKPKGECDDSDAALASGLERAAEIVRRVRAGEFFDLEGWRPFEDTFSAICGVGLVGPPVAGQDETQ